MGFKLASLFCEITCQDSGFRRGLASAHLGLLGLANSAASLGALGVFGAAGSLTAGLGISAKAAIDLETKFVALAKATDLDPSGMKALKAEIYGLASGLKGISLDNLVGIATAGAKMGIAAGDLREFTEGIAKVSTAMDDIPAEQIAEQTGKINVVFKLGVKGALQLGSAIDKLADSGVSSSSGILNVTQRLSGAAAAAKISAADTTALAAALLDTGTQAELGASALGRLIMGLNDVDSRKGFAQVLGEDATKFAKRVEAGPIDAIAAFLDKLRGLDAGSQVEALKGIGFDGVQGIGEIQKLAQQVDSLRDYSAKARREFDTLDQSTKSYAATSETVGAKLTQVKNQFLILAEKIGTALMPPIRVGLDLLSGLVSALGSAFDNLVIGVSTAADRVKNLPQAITDAFGPGPVAMVKGLGSAISNEVSAKLELLGFALRNFPDLIEIAALEGMQSFYNLGEQIKVIPENLSIIGNYIRNNWAKLVVDGVNLVSTVFKNLATNFASLGSAIAEFWKNPTKGFRLDWTDLTEGFKAEADKLPDLIEAKRVSPFQAEIDERVGRIARREDDLKKAQELKKGDGGKAKAAAAAGDGDAAGLGKGKSKVSDLLSFAHSLQEAVSGKGRVAERAAVAAERTAKAVEKIAAKKDSPAPGFAAGPAWGAAGLT